jgi:hypothetical protein
MSTPDQPDQGKSGVGGCLAQIGGFRDFTTLSGVLQPFLRGFVLFVVIVFAHGNV